MRLQEGSNKLGQGNGNSKAIDVLRVEPKRGHSFDVREILHPGDLVLARDHYEDLVSAGRMHNASQIVSGMTLAYGSRPVIFNEHTEDFKSYIDGSGFNADGVLENILIAYPEARADLANSATKMWQEYAKDKPLPLSVGPEDLVVYKIIKPDQQAHLELDLRVLETNVVQLFHSLARQDTLGVAAGLLSHVLLADPTFKTRIPNLDELKHRFRQEIIVWRAKGSANDWTEAARLLKALVLLSADQVGISSEGQVYIRYDHLGSSSQPPLPTRHLV